MIARTALDETKTVITCCKECGRTIEKEDGQLYLRDPKLGFVVSIRFIDAHGFVNGLWSLSNAALKKLEEICGCSR